MWNDESELRGDSYYLSNIQYDIKYIIKKHETLTTIPPIHVYINNINNGLVFKIKHRIEAKISNAWDNKMIWQHKKNNRQNKKRRKCANS